MTDAKAHNRCASLRRITRLSSATSSFRRKQFAQVLIELPVDRSIRCIRVQARHRPPALASAPPRLWP